MPVKLGLHPGGVPNWEYLSLTSDVQLVDGDAKAVDVGSGHYWARAGYLDTVFSNNRVTHPTGNPGYYGGVLTEGGVAKGYDGDFIFEGRILSMLTATSPWRGLQVGTGTGIEDEGYAVLTVYANSANTMNWYGSAVSNSNVADTTGLVKIQADGTALKVYVNDVLKVTGTRPAGTLYLKMGMQSGVFSYAAALQAIQPIAPVGYTMSLPTTTTGTSSNVNIRDFTGDVSSAGPITVSAGATTVVDTDLYSAPTTYGFSLSGLVMSLIANQSGDAHCVNRDSSNNPVAFDGDFIFEAQVDEMDNKSAKHGIQVSDVSTYEHDNEAVGTLYAWNSNSSTPRYQVWYNGTLVETIGAVGSGLIKIEALGTVLNFYVDGELFYAGTRPSGNLYLKMYGQDSTNSTNIITVTAIRAEKLSYTGTVLKESNYKIDTSKGSFNFISPLGTLNWVPDNNTGNWG